MEEFCANFHSRAIYTPIFTKFEYLRSNLYETVMCLFLNCSIFIEFVRSNIQFFI